MKRPNFKEMVMPFGRSLGLFAGLLMACCVFGQWEYGAYGGFGYSKVNTEKYPATGRGEYQEVESRSSWSIGATISHPITERLSFTTGLVWSYFAGRNESGGRGTVWLEEQWKLNYVYVPLMLRLEFHRFHIGAGYQLGTPLHGSLSATNYYQWLGPGYSDQYFETDDIGLKPTDIGVVAEAGVRAADRFDIGVRYYRGLQDIKDHSDGYPSPLGTEQLILTVGFRIWPAKRTRNSEENLTEPEVGSPE